MTPSNVDIRQFILDTFNERDFNLFCADYFPQTRGDFAPSDPFKINILTLIEYCQNREITDNLLADLQKERPVAYARRFGPAVVQPQEIAAPPTAIVRNPHQIFVSHAHQDAEFAHRLARDLRAQGWPVWIAPDNIRPGEKWVAAIGRGLDESGVFLALLTPAAVASRWVSSETESAIELEHDDRLRLIPLLVQPCAVPILVRRYHRVSFIADYGTGLAQLLAALEPSPPVATGATAQPEAVQPHSEQAPKRSVKAPKAKVKKPTSSARIAQVPTPDLLVIEQPFHLELVRVPAGEFLMGSDPAKDEAAKQWEAEQPQHRVYVSEFYIGKYAVTNAQFAVFAQATHYQTTAETAGTSWAWTGSKWDEAKGANWQHPRGPGSNVIVKADHPVVQVSWEDAVAFCQWLSQVTGKAIGLPSEAQWEKAARGTEGQIYPWNDQWEMSRANTSEGGVKDTTPVGQYSPAGDSPYGAADMAGNVWEWCADWYNEDEYKAHSTSGSPVTDPTGPSSGDRRVVRGGSWDLTRVNARAAYRYGDSPDLRDYFCGFRVVAAPVP